jgi:hypothetical protein
MIQIKRLKNKNRNTQENIENVKSTIEEDNDNNREKDKGRESYQDDNPDKHQ